MQGASLASRWHPANAGGPCHCPWDWATPGAPCSDCTLATEPGPDLHGDRGHRAASWDQVPEQQTFISPWCGNWAIQRLSGLSDGWLPPCPGPHMAQGRSPAVSSSADINHIRYSLTLRIHIVISIVIMEFGVQRCDFEGPNSVYVLLIRIHAMFSGLFNTVSLLTFSLSHTPQAHSYCSFNPL